MEKITPGRNDNRIWFGLFLLFIGAGWLLHQMNFPLPYWLFSWKVFLIVLGIFLGFRSGFRSGGWPIPIIIGTIFLAEDFFPAWQWHVYLWPIVLIVMGIYFIVRPRHRHHRHWDRWNDWKDDAETGNPGISNEDFLDHTVVFGSVEKTVVAKAFKGGDITCFFGGIDLNFMHADIQGRVVLDVTQVFGGTKLIVPANWTIKSETAAVFGGVQDKRMNQVTADPDKVLVLKGVTVFGGFEIMSY